MRVILIILSFALLYSSCKKKGKADFTLRGTITDTSLATSLGGATIQLFAIEAGTTQDQLIGTTSTSSDGTYSFIFKRDNVLSYKLKIQKQNYFSINSSINFSDMTIESDNIRNYSTTAKSWVALRFVNVAPANSSDNLRYRRIVGKSDCLECCSPLEQSIIGAVDTTVYCINDGNSTYKVTYSLLGTSLIGDQSVITSPFDTTELLLSY